MKHNKQKSSLNIFQNMGASRVIPKPRALQLPSTSTVGHVGEFICGVHHLLHLASVAIWTVALSHTGKWISLRGHLNLKSNHSRQSGSEGRQSKRLFIFLTLSGVRLRTKCQPRRRSCHLGGQVMLLTEKQF